MKMATDLNHSPSIGVARMGHEGKSGIDRATLVPGVADDDVVKIILL